jgi:hypothetical protein
MDSDGIEYGVPRPPCMDSDGIEYGVPRPLELDSRRDVRKVGFNAKFLLKLLLFL